MHTIEDFADFCRSCLSSNLIECNLNARHFTFFKPHGIDKNTVKFKHFFGEDYDLYSVIIRGVVMRLLLTSMKSMGSLVQNFGGGVFCTGNAALASQGHDNRFVVGNWSLFAFWRFNFFLFHQTN